MPSHYIHMSVMRHAAAALAEEAYRPPASDRIDPRWAGDDTQELGGLLQEHANFANLGAIGPDLFFFLPDFRDWMGIPTSSVLVTILDFLEELEDAFGPYVEKWEEYLGPISEDTEEAISRLTGGLSDLVGDILGELRDILIAALEKFATEQRDWLSFFSLGLNRGYDEQAYFWSDMLHYRATGRFARALYQRASAAGDDGARAYALGYVTHVATDTAAHPFVNAISGGPFRCHWQRHHLVENHMDAAWYLTDDTAPRSGTQYPQVTESALHYDIAFGADDAVVARPAYPTGNTLRERWERSRMLDIDSELPGVVATILVQAMQDVYYATGEPHPEILRENDGRPSEELVSEAYGLLFKFLKLTTLDGFDHEPPDPPELFPNLDFPTASDPLDEPPDDNDDSFFEDLWEFLLALIAAIAYIFEVALWFATVVWGVLADLGTYPLRYLLWWAVEMPLFQMLKQLRYALVMTGYIMPMDDEISTPLIHVGRTAARSWDEVLEDLGDPFGGLDSSSGEGTAAFRDRQYPRSHPDDEFEHPWDYPDSASELPLTVAGPYPENADPAALFRDRDPSANILDALGIADTPARADAVGQSLAPNASLGDPVGFAKYLLWLETRSEVQADGSSVPVVDWNLDADRGYGYQGWDWNRHPESEAFPAVPDPEGKLFRQPCTWPQQAEQPPAPGPWDPAIPLQLHYVGPGREDPGCESAGGTARAALPGAATRPRPRMRPSAFRRRRAGPQ